MERNPIEMLLDEENSENIILYNEDGVAVEFEQIAIVPLNGRLFALLHPVEPDEGMDEDTGIVFELITLDDGEEVLEVAKGEDIIDAVFEEYYAMVDEALSGQE